MMLHMSSLYNWFISVNWIRQLTFLHRHTSEVVEAALEIEKLSRRTDNIWIEEVFRSLGIDVYMGGYVGYPVKTEGVKWMC